MVSLSTAITFYSVIGLALLFDEDRARTREKSGDKGVLDPLQVRSPCGTHVCALRQAEQAVAVTSAASDVGDFSPSAWTTSEYESSAASRGSPRI